MNLYRQTFAVLWLLVPFSLAATRADDVDRTAVHVVPLWEDGAPGFEDRRDEPETGEQWWVANIHNPSLTVYPAGENANGTAVVIVPGGGHRKLVINAEGNDMAKRFAELGITAFVLKHRLAREEGSPYQIDVHAKQDGQRAMRWVRHHASEYGIVPERVGMMGFSAGGEVVSMVVYGDTEGDANAADPIDQLGCNPNFQILVYPGPLGIPDTFSKPLPPAFMVVASDDGAVASILKVASLYQGSDRNVKKSPYEVHIFATGGHGFNLGQRSDLRSIKTWPDRLDVWLLDQGWLKRAN